MARAAAERPRAIPAEFTHPTTAGQRALFATASQSDAASCAGHVGYALTLRGTLQHRPLLHAVNTLIARHDALRTCFNPNGSLLQGTMPWLITLPVLDLSSEPEEKARQRLRLILTGEMETPFDLNQVPLFRYQLVRVTSVEHVLIYCAHHLVCDDWSARVLVHELAALYQAEIKGEDSQMAPAPRFIDHAAWWSERQSAAESNSDPAFWQRLLSDPVPKLELPHTITGGHPSERAEHVVVPLPPELLTKLTDLGRITQCGLFCVLLSGVYVWLYRLSGQQRLVIGVPAPGQSLAGESRLVGACLNVVPVICQVDPRFPFGVFLRRARVALQNALSHQPFPYADWRETQVDDPNASLVTVQLQAEPQPNLPTTFGDLKLAIERVSTRFQTLPLQITIEPHAKHPSLQVSYQKDVFTEDWVRSRCEALECLLISITEDATTTVGNLNILTPAERALLFGRVHPERR